MLNFISMPTDPGSFKLTDISYRLRFSFISFACIVRSFSVRVIVSFVSLIRKTHEKKYKRTIYEKKTK